MQSQRHHIPNAAKGGFTLMELIAVVVILGILAGAVTPMFQGSLRRMRNDRAWRDMVSTLRHAGELAVLESADHRVCFDTEHEAYWIERLDGYDDGEKVYTRLPGKEGLPTDLPHGMTFRRLTAQRGDGMGMYFVEFHPSGSCDTAVLRLEGANGDDIEIHLEGTVNRIEVEVP